MLHHWMKKLMPKEDKFVILFTEQGNCLKKSVTSLHNLLTNSDGTQSIIELSQIEKEADKISQSIYQLLNQSFSTPFRRGEIRSLVYALDSIADLSEDVGKRMQIYHITTATPAMAQLSQCITDCVTLLQQALPLTTNLSKNAEKINYLCEQIHTIENKADDIHEKALSELYPTDSVSNALLLERIYDLIEEVVDSCHHVANILSNIVAENA